LAGLLPLLLLLVLSPLMVVALPLLLVRVAIQL
jgi:hypothetical protein